MHKRTTTLIIGCIAVLSAAAAGEVPAQAAPSGVVMSAGRAFGIPFQLPAATEATAAPREVLLYVSQDRGVNWRLASRVRPDARQFSFQAFADGEHWFLVRTVDGNGQVSRAEVSKPGLRVIIDTVKPKIELRCQLDLDRLLHATFRIDDVNLDTGQVVLEYQLAGSPTWQAVAAADVQAGQGGWSRATWKAEAKGLVKVRLRAADRAGNQAVAEAVVQTARSSQRDQPAAAPVPANNAGQIPVPTAVPREVDAAVLKPQVERPAAIVAEPAAPKLPDQPDSVGSAPDDRPIATGPHPTPRQITQPSTAGRNEPAAAPKSPQTTRVAPTTEPERRKAPVTRTPEPQPQVAGQAARPLMRSEPVDPVGANSPLIFETTTFQLPYVNRSNAAVSKAELWGTSDSGRNWTYYGTDVDRVSPFHVTVPGPGLYGFRLLLQRNGERTLSEPVPGDLPNIWVLIHGD